MTLKHLKIACAAIIFAALSPLENRAEDLSFHGFMTDSIVIIGTVTTRKSDRPNPRTYLYHHAANVDYSTSDPLIIVDGAEVSDLYGLRPNNIVSIKVLQGDVLKESGINGNRTVFVITTKASRYNKIHYLKGNLPLNTPGLPR